METKKSYRTILVVKTIVRNFRKGRGWPYAWNMHLSYVYGFLINLSNFFSKFFPTKNLDLLDYLLQRRRYAVRPGRARRAFQNCYSFWRCKFERITFNLQTKINFDKWNSWIYLKRYEISLLFCVQHTWLFWICVFKMSNNGENPCNCLPGNWTGFGRSYAIHIEFKSLWQQMKRADFFSTRKTVNKKAVRVRFSFSLRNFSGKLFEVESLNNIPAALKIFLPRTAL